MISSQLGRMILNGSTPSSSDEMRVKPDAEGEYDPIEGVLDEIAGRVRAEPDQNTAVNGPGTESSAD